MRLVGPQYNSQPSIHQQQHPVVNGNGSFVESPLTTTTTTTTTTSNNGGVAGYPLDEFPNLIQPINDFQYIDANGNIVKGVPAFVSPDGRQIILKDIDPISGIGEAIVTPPPQPQQQPASFIVQHHMAPSAVSVSANSTLARNTSSNNNNHQASMNGNGFGQGGARVTSSSSNLTTHQQQQQQQQPVIINNKHASSSVEATNGSQDTRRVSNATNSLAAGKFIYSYGGGF